MQARQGRIPRTSGKLGLPHALMVVAGLATFVLVASVLRDRAETVPVWMVDTNIAAGASVVVGDLVEVEVAADSPLLDPLLVVGDAMPSGRARTDLAAGEPLLASDLVPLDAAVAGRTFTLPVETMVVEGLGLIRGDRVDVIGSLPNGLMGYVVADVEVVRLPTASNSGAFAAASSRTTWVTVSIDDDEALVLSAAIDRGDLQLVRSTGAAAIEVVLEEAAAGNTTAAVDGGSS